MGTELEQEQLFYRQFARERLEVERLVERIEAKIGCPVEVCLKKSGRWGFYAKWKEDGDWENFAFAHKRKRAKCLRKVQGAHKEECLRKEKCLCVHTKEEWASCARVPRSRYCVNPTGWWDEPAAHVDMNQDDAKSLEEVASILARICKARHR